MRPVREVLHRVDRVILPPVSAVMARLGRGARRVRIVRIVATVISVAVVLVAVYAAGRTPQSAPAETGSVVRIGVVDGQSIPQYVATQKAQLSRLVASGAKDAGRPAAKQPKFYALVSMSEYLDPQQLTTLIQGLDVQITDAIMRVPSARQTQIIQVSVASLPGDLFREMAAIAVKKQREATDDLNLESQVSGDSSVNRMLRAEYADEADLAKLEATRYAARCGCVYAAVIYGTPKVFAALAMRPKVRAIDARVLRWPDLAVFTPPLPEQHGVAGPPPSSTPSLPGT